MEERKRMIKRPKFKDNIKNNYEPGDLVLWHSDRAIQKYIFCSILNDIKYDYVGERKIDDGEEVKIYIMKDIAEFRRKSKLNYTFIITKEYDLLIYLGRVAIFEYNTQVDDIYCMAPKLFEKKAFKLLYHCNSGKNVLIAGHNNDIGRVDLSSL